MTTKRSHGLDKRGSEFYEAVTGELELEPHETALLLEACRVLDRLEALDAIIVRQGYTLPDGRILPAVTEARLQGVTFARLVASLRLPDDYAASHLDRGQRRGGARGTYVPREKLEAMRSAKAR